MAVSNDSDKREKHILVCLFSSPSNERIVRTAAKMSHAFGGSFTALLSRLHVYEGGRRIPGPGLLFSIGFVSTLFAAASVGSYVVHWTTRPPGGFMA